MSFLFRIAHYHHRWSWTSFRRACPVRWLDQRLKSTRKSSSYKLSCNTEFRPSIVHAPILVTNTAKSRKRLKNSFNNSIHSMLISFYSMPNQWTSPTRHRLILTKHCPRSSEVIVIHRSWRRFQPIMLVKYFKIFNRTTARIFDRRRRRLIFILDLQQHRLTRTHLI